MKWTIRLSALTGGLLFALAVHFAWHWHDPLSLCDIDLNPEKYSGRTIRVRALVFNDVFIGGRVYVEPRVSAFAVCHGRDDWPAAIVDLDTQQRSLVPETRYLWRREYENQLYVTDAILVGMFDPHDDGVTRCFGPRYELVNAKVERVFSTHELSREQFFEWIKSKAH